MEAVMTELTTLIIICVLDWVVAHRAMVYTTQKVPTGIGWVQLGPKMLPFYEKTLLGTDMYHVVGWVRYLAFTALAWESYGWRDIGYHFLGWELHSALLYPLTAAICYAGWQVLKHLHGKQWPPIWRRWF